MSKLGFSYKRWSNAQQGDGLTLERQTDIAKEICVEKGWMFRDLPADKGVSAWKGKNIHEGALGAFIKKVEAGEIPKGSVLIIEKMDRFSRNEVDLVLPIFLQLLQNGIEVYSCIERMHYTLAEVRKNPTVYIMQMVMAFAMANDFNKTLSDRINRTLQLNYGYAAKGIPVKFGGLQPRWIDFVPNQQNPKTGTFRLNDKAEIVRGMIEDYLDGKSMFQIATELNNRDVKPLGHGKGWQQATVQHFISSEALLGTITIKGKRFEKYYPSVITEDQWNQLQARLSQNKKRKGTAQNILNLFPNRCECQECGGRVTSATAPNGTYYYRCLNSHYTRKDGKQKAVKQQCTVREFMRIDEFERIFFGECACYAPSDFLNGHSKEGMKEVQIIQGKIVDVTKKIEKLVALAEDMDIQELKVKLNTLKTQRDHLETELTEAKHKATNQTNLPAAVNDFTALLKKDLQSNEVRKKFVAVVPSIVEKIVFDLKGKDFTVHFTTGEKWEMSLNIVEEQKDAKGKVRREFTPSKLKV